MRSPKVLRAGPRVAYKGAFIAKHGSIGRLQVMVRVGKDQYPIKTLRAISIPVTLRNKAVRAALQAEGRLDLWHLGQLRRPHARIGVAHGAVAPLLAGVGHRLPEVVVVVDVSDDAELGVRHVGQLQDAAVLGNRGVYGDGVRTCRVRRLTRLGDAIGEGLQEAFDIKRVQK